MTRFSQLPSPRPSKKQKSSRGQRGEEDEEDEVGGCCLLDKQSADCGGRLISALRSGRFPLDSSPSPSSLLRCVYTRAVCSHERRRRRRRRREKGKVIIIPLFRVWRGVAWRTESGKRETIDKHVNVPYRRRRRRRRFHCAQFTVQFSRQNEENRNSNNNNNNNNNDSRLLSLSSAQLSSVQY